MLTCKHCKKETKYLEHVHANIIQSPVDDAWVINLILACPHCGQKLNAFTTVMNFEPLEAPDENDD